MKDALAVIDAEIALLAARLDGLQHARGLLAAATGMTAKKPPAPLLLEGPGNGAKGKDQKTRKTKAPKKGRGALKREPDMGHYSHAFEVNSIDIPCTEQQAAMLELLAAAEGDSCVSGVVLMPIFDNSKHRMMRAIADCCVHLKAAHATIQGVKPKGYRLINIEV